MRITHQSVTLNKETNTRLALLKQQWYQKWNRILASVVCVLGFILLFSFVMVTMTMEDASTKSSGTQNKISEVDNRVQHLSNAINACSRSGCTFTCTNLGQEENISEALAPLIEGSDCQEIEKLIITKSTFPNRAIKPNWLEINLNILLLRIESCTLENIEPLSFDKSCFRTLKDLQLIDLMVSHLKDNVFYNLISLENLRFEKVRLTEVDYTVMEPVSYNLIHLYLINVPQPLELQNVTGNYAMNKLEVAELTDCNFGKILPSTFAGLNSVQSLYLQRSGITQIDEKAFTNMVSSVRQIFLDNNALTTMTENTIKDLIPRTKIYLSSNNWICDCKLEWLQHYLKAYNNSFPDEPYCGAIKMRDYDFINCSDTSSTRESTLSTGITSDETLKTDTESSESLPTELPSIPTSSLTTTESDIKDSNLIIVNCQKNTTLKFSGTSKIQYNFLQVTEETIFTYEEGFNMKFSQNNDAVTVSVSKSEIVLYFKSDYDVTKNDVNSESIGCYVSYNVIEIKGLAKNCSYTICGLNKNSTVISPFNCRGFQTLLKWEDQTWISNKNMPYVVGGVTGIIILILIIVLLFLYFYIHRRKKWSHGRGAVLFKKHHPTDAMVMPRDINCMLTADINGRPDYIIPMSKYRPPYVRSSSDGSMVSARSYVSAVEPTQMQLISWRLDRMRERWIELETTKSVPDMPPPLPPRNSIEIDVHTQITHSVK